MDKEKYVLVVNNSYHENSAVLIKGKTIISGLEEERTSRNRHAVGEEASTCIKRLLEEENITIEDIDELYIDIDDMLSEFDGEKIVRMFLTRRLGVKYMSKIKKLPKLVVNTHNHHHARHALASFYTSGFKSACSICIDGQGDLNDSVTLSYIGEDGEIKLIKRFPDNCSLGRLYAIASNMVTGSRSEGKFMGLASFGRPRKELPLYYTEDGECVDNISDKYGDNLEAYFLDNCYPFCQGNYGLYKDLLYYVDFAATIQECINVSLLNLAKYMKKLYPSEKNLVLSGGVTLNCTANGILDQANIFENIFCFPATNDAGTAWGSAYYYLKKFCGVDSFPRLHAPYYGPKYDVDNYIKLLIRQNVPALVIEKINSPQTIVEEILKSGMVAWYQDGSECGPRALGHRSLLGDPRHVDNWKYISIDIKKREVYRPLAPIVLAEHYNEVFEDIHPDNLTEFMLKNVKIKKEWVNKIPAVCHVDFTARPQLLYRETNPELYDVIEEFYKQTGIPLLINTSFNNPGMPIVENIEEACAYIIKQKADKKNVVLFVDNKYKLYTKRVTG